MSRQQNILIVIDSNLAGIKISQSSSVRIWFSQKYRVIYLSKYFCIKKSFHLSLFLKHLNNFYAEVYKSGFLQLSETTIQLLHGIQEVGLPVVRFTGSFRTLLCQIEASLSDKTSRKFDDTLYGCVQCALRSWWKSHIKY